MNRIAASSLLLVLMLNSVYARDWVSTVARVERSIVRVTQMGTIEKGEHVCAGFVINARRGHVLTAYHCLWDGDIDNKEGHINPYFQVDGLPSYVEKEFPDSDLVVVALPVLGKPSLDYRRKPVRKGLPVAALGFAYGLTGSTLLTGTLAAPEANWGEEGLWQVVDRHSIGGMSGGPVFDMEGRVVAVAQRTDDRTYVSRPLAVVVELTKSFWD